MRNLQREHITEQIFFAPDQLCLMTQHPSVAEIVNECPLFSKTRIPSLYGDFARLELLNPEGYAANITAWQALLTRLVSHAQISRSRFCLDTHHLQDSLILPGHGKPRGLAQVIKQLCADKVLVSRPDYVRTDKSAVAWIASALGRLLSSAPAVVDSQGRLLPSHYVFPHLVADFAARCVEIVYDSAHNTFTDLLLQSLLQLSGESFTASDWEVLVAHLVNTKKCVAHSVDGDRYLYFGTGQIPVAEIGAAELRTTVLQLDGKVKDTEQSIASVQQQIMALLAPQQPATSKNRLYGLLRYKRLLSKSLDRITSAQTELQAVMVKVSDAALNSVAFAQLTKTRDLLRSLNTINVDDVLTLKDDIASEADAIDQVTEALQDALHDHDQEDDIEQEYQQLLALETEKKLRDQNVIAEEAEKLVAMKGDKGKVNVAGNFSRSDDRAKNDEQAVLELLAKLLVTKAPTAEVDANPTKMDSKYTTEADETDDDPTKVLEPIPES